MKRTVTMDHGCLYYRGKEVEYMYSDMRDHFGLKDSETHKYVITITESKTGKYRFAHSGNMYAVYKGKKCISEVCKNHLVRIFFRPLVKKRYNISVRKVKIRRTRQSE